MRFGAPDMILEVHLTKESIVDHMESPDITSRVNS
jgi:hypothetical protein